MPPVRVFINGSASEAPEGATALDAVRALDAAEAARIDRGERLITDSRGLPIDHASPAFAGAIYRTIRAKPAPE
jgi:hypothetical protein